VIPFVRFELDLEGTPRCRIVAQCEADERALLAWLAGSPLTSPLVELAWAVDLLRDALEDEREGV
jgi:hypothetical protein